MKRYSKPIQKLVDRATRAQKAKRTKSRAQTPVHPSRLTLSEFIAGLPRDKKSAKKKAAKKRTVSRSKLRHPSLPPDHPFNRPRRKKSAKRKAPKRKAPKRKAPKRKAPKRKAPKRKAPSANKSQLMAAAERRYKQARGRPGNGRSQSGLARARGFRRVR